MAEPSGSGAGDGPEVAAPTSCFRPDCDRPVIGFHDYVIPRGNADSDHVARCGWCEKHQPTLKLSPGPKTRGD